jgi:hypothetical protein
MTQQHAETTSRKTKAENKAKIKKGNKQQDAI